MSHKHKHAKHAGAGPESLRPRVDRAIAEGRFQQALDLAKQLHKYEPTPAHLELLKKAYLGRARQLHTSGYDRDAATVLEAAQRIDAANPAWLEQLATELAACGAAGKALELVKQVPNSPVSAAVLVRAADAAVQQEAAGKAQLPPELHADFDRVLQAFRQVEKGEDEAAKETLQGLGLKSPFLEWKLFLRGLQAFYQNDDARALENWGRLNSERVPARLAAPFRGHIDRSFRDAQPAETQAALKTQFDRLQGSVVADQLRRLRTALADTETRTFAGVFRQVEALLPVLRTEAPQLIPRLAACCYWAVLETGPDDALRFKRVFGAPPDDPNFHRLEALAGERSGDLGEANRAWQAYEQEIAAAPASAWPPELAARARALIWLRMGKNAAVVPGRKQRAKLPPHLRDAADWPAPLKPSAEQCLERCVALAPDMLEPYEALFHYHLAEERPDQAEKAGRKLLERFPDHVPTLTALGRMLHRDQQYAEALGMFQRALKANPLDRKLRAGVSVAHVGCARLELDGGNLDAARHAASVGPDLQRRPGRQPDPQSLGGGGIQGGERRGCGATASGSPPACRRRFPGRVPHVDGVRPPQVGQEAQDALRQGGAGGLPRRADARGRRRRAKRCRGTQERRHHVRRPEDAREEGHDVGRQGLRAANLRARQYVDVITALTTLDAHKPAQRVAEAAAKKYKKDPEFPVLQARLPLRPDGRQRPRLYQIRPLLDRADKLVRELPREDERRERLTKEVADLQQLVDALDPFSRLHVPGPVRRHVRRRTGRRLR